MKRLIVTTAVISALILSGCEQAQQAGESNETQAQHQTSQALPMITQSSLDQIAQSLKVNYQLVTNIPTDKCDKEKADGACFEVLLSLTANTEIKSKDWSIYFSQISPIQSYESDSFSVKHINGDLHRISLKDDFAGFEKGETKTLLFRANFWSLSETDALPNYIVAADNLTAKVIESTKTVINPDTGLEVLPYVSPYTDEVKQFKRTHSDKTQWLTTERLFERNQAVTKHRADIENVIIPTPMQLTSQAGTLDITQGLALNWHNVALTDVDAAIQRLASLGVVLNPKGVPLNLRITPDEDAKIGSYQLQVASEGISVVGVDANGVFNGLQSLAGLKTIGSNHLPLVEVNDEPHYAFRGILVDVSRNFHNKAFILKLLDQMAAYKMNKLHLHLGDDEGWRLEIPSLPELTDIGSKRCFDPSEQTCLLPQLGAGTDSNSGVNGFYSVADYQEILVEAKRRYIQVIPSLDMPGHSRAAVKSMAARYNKFMAKEQPEKAEKFLLHDPEDKTVYSSVQYYNDNTINVCLESSYHFIETVMKDVKAIHSEVNHPLTRYHIGADETAGAWVESPACKAFLAKHNAQIAGPKELGAYFVERVSNMLADLGIEAAAWIDGLEHTNPNNMPAVIQANAWHPLAWGGHQSAHKLANYNWQMVVSSPDVTYFDFPYEADPKEHGYYWASRQINTRKMFNFMPDNLPVHAEFWLDRADNAYIADDTVKTDESGKIISAPMNKGVKFLGLQGQLWSENTRTEATAEYKIFPRLIALAERAWHSANWAVPYNYEGFKYSQDTNTFTDEKRKLRDTAWFDFAHTIGKKELPKLELGNINYRLPTVGAKIINGLLHANIAFPGITIEYRLLEGEWQKYTGPVKVDSQVSVRSVSHQLDRYGRELVIENIEQTKLNN
ncbi:family 20 glycosylhydrolase [Thalassotalea sp. M1531]|uniref:beta-N-acetylhexosaminidase n=1 Tax=Thalassotalea algicola TaxID=2716224 RepID=A0A7Y0Q6S3_9GAMM|nr:family 20 glycosylhydrolase [Thalassotalea algicola]NMP30275.1 family 20 glycosylhydrolase [Thalassotalea algicola]